MNRPHVLDLRPGHSFVEYMLRHGYDVYLLDWGVARPEDRNLKFDDYALDYMPRAIRKMKAVSGSSEFSMLGWCIGALISTLYAALRPDDGLHNLILLTAPLDFTDKQAGGFARWTERQVLRRRQALATFGNMPGRDDRLRRQGAQAGRELHRQLLQPVGQPRQSQGRRSRGTR